MKPQGVLLGSPISSSQSGGCLLNNQYNVDIRVYWYGNVTTWLNEVIIEDTLGHGLFSGTDDGAIQNSALSFKTAYPLVKRFYLNDEPYISTFLAYNYVQGKILQKYAPDDTANGTGSGIVAEDHDFNRFLIDAQPHELLIDPYVITADIPTPDMTDAEADDVGIVRMSSVDYTQTLQNYIQAYYIGALGTAAVGVSNHKQFWCVPQLHGVYFDTLGKFRSPVNNSAQLRPPTGNEVDLLANLALAYGAKGLVPYPFGTDAVNSNGYNQHFAGLVSNVAVNGLYKNHWSNYGTFPSNGTNKQVKMGYQEKWNALSGLNVQLQQIGSTLFSLNWQGTKSWNTGNYIGTWSNMVTNVSTNITGETPYVETGLFNAGTTNYVYVVNRRTLSTDSRNITISLNNNASWEILDVASGNTWIIAPNGSFTDIFQPGCGKLYKASPAIYTATRTIARGATLTVSAGAIAQFAQNTGLTINGKLNVSGTLGSPALFTQSSSNGWTGITLNYDSSTIGNCTISYASSPISINNVNTATITNVIINNSLFAGTQAVYVSNSSPSISNLEINGLTSGSSNGIRYTNGRGGTLMGATIQNCGAGNGIVIQGNCSPTITDCEINSNYYYGIIATSNGTGSPLIDYGYFSGNGTHGSTRQYFNIYFTASNGTVQGNTLTGSLIGVGAYAGSKIYAGIGQTGANTITGNNYGLMCRGAGSFMSFGSYDKPNGDYPGACNSIYGDTVYNAYADGGAVIQAQYDWWGQSPPDTSKITTATVIYSNWLTSQGGCPRGALIAQGNSSLTTNVDSSGSISDVYQRASDALSNQSYTTSSSLFQFIIRSSASVSVKQGAMVGLLNVFFKTSDVTIISDLNSYIVGTDCLSQTAEGLLAYAYAATGKTSNAVSLANDLISKNPGTEIEKQSLLLLASLRTFDKSAESISSSALATVKAKYGSSLDQGLMAALTTANDVAAVSLSPNKSAAQKAKGEAKVENANGPVTEYGIENYPNPFNPTTTIAYQLPKDGKVTIKIFDAIGRVVTTLVDEYKPSGRYTVQFDASRLASGIYFYSLRSGSFNVVKKMSLIK